MHFTQYDTRVAGYALIVDDGKILLSWWNGGPDPARAAWTLPGGGIELDEQIEDGLLREITEETGYTAELTGLLMTSSGVGSPGASGRPFKAVRIVYTARVIGGTLGTLEVDGSTDFAAWVPLDELPGAGPRVQLVDAALAASQR